MKVFIRQHFPRFFLFVKWLYYWLLAIPCLGYGVECPCCDAHYRRFVTFHGHPSLCPRCWSIERHRALFRYLEQETDIFHARLRVLHFAPDALERKLRAASNLEYISADLSDPRAMQHFDICHIPYPDSSFDVILCSHVLEYAPDDCQAMRELYRVLKPGSWSLLLDPIEWDRATTYEITNPQEYKRLLRQEGRVMRIYGPDYLDRLESVGFAVSHLSSYNPDIVRAWKKRGKETERKEMYLESSLQDK